MPNSRFLELLDDVGLAPSHTVHKKTGLEVPNDGTHGRPAAGEPEPLSSITVSVPITRMIGKELVPDVVPVEIKPGEEFHEQLDARIIPGTRTVECRHPALFDLLLNIGHYRECDPPKSEQPRTPRDGKSQGKAGGEEE